MSNKYQSQFTGLEIDQEIKYVKDVARQKIEEHSEAISKKANDSSVVKYTEKNKPNGYLGLNEKGKIDASLLPDGYNPDTPNNGDYTNGHSPYIGENGNWFEWSDLNQEYIDTGVMASGVGDDSVLYKIIDPDNNPIEEIEDEVYVLSVELGGLDRATGELAERDDAIRSKEFIEVIAGSTIYFTSNVPLVDDYSIRILCYDANQTFIEYKNAKLEGEWTLPSTCKYVKFYRSDTNDTTVEMALVTKGTTKKAEFKKIYFADHGYEIYGAPMDDETMHKLVIDSSGKDNNEYSIIELRAPNNDPCEATLALMNSGENVCQFVDFSSMVYDPDNPTVEIVCQTRGGYKLPAFSVRFNDGQGAGRVKKFVVHPDAIPIEMTSSGLKVRKNNTYDNNGADEDYVTINLVEMESEIKSVSNEVDVLKENGVNGNGIGDFSDGLHAEIFNDYENNIALSNYSHAEGYSTVAGMKGFYYYSIEFGEESDKITVTDTQRALSDKDFSDILANYPTGNYISLVNNEKYPNCAKILSIEGNVITVEKLPFTSVADVSDLSTDDFSLWVQEKPEVGLVNLGYYAHAEGENTKALERASHAEGRDTMAIGQYSHAEGRNTQAGYNGHAEGRDTVASGIISHAEGYKSIASGDYGSHAEGFQTEASGMNGAHAEGLGTIAEGDASHAEGHCTKANGMRSHAEGESNVAYAYASHVEGYNTRTGKFNDNGEYIVDTAKYSHAEGTGTTASGQSSHAEGHCTTASGMRSHTEGTNTTASGHSSHAEGYYTTASGMRSHTEGTNTTASGPSSHAEGSESVASEDYSHAEGYYTKASGHSSHAEGYCTTASGIRSHSEGFQTVAGGDYSHAEGHTTAANGQASHAEGTGTTASGLSSHAEGHCTTASGMYSHAEGDCTKASGTNQHVQGKFNVEDTENKYAHIVGGGSGDTNRKNIHTIDWSGNAEFAGTVKSNGQLLATEEYVQSYIDEAILGGAW